MIFLIKLLFLALVGTIIGSFLGYVTGYLNHRVRTLSSKSYGKGSFKDFKKNIEGIDWNNTSTDRINATTNKNGYVYVSDVLTKEEINLKKGRMFLGFFDYIQYRIFLDWLKNDLKKKDLEKRNNIKWD